MQPENYRYGGGGSASLLHPIVLIAMILAILLLFILPRNKIVIPFLCMSFLVPLGQQFNVGGVHLFVLRIVILLALIRAFASRDISQSSVFAGGINGVDRAFLVCTFAQIIAVVLLFREGQAVVNQIGYLWDFLGGYFLLRALIQNEDDVYTTLKCLAFLTIPLTLAMFWEQIKMVNVFGMLGGIPLAPEVREGKIRSQGVFEHSLMAGAFAATLIPLFFLFWRKGRSKLIGTMGLAGSIAMSIFTNSSTALLTIAASFFALLMWSIRKKMRTVRWGIACTLIGLHLIMKAPVWFLIARIDVTGSSSSYHRADLVDQFIKHFTDWWLIGTNKNGEWGLDMFDVQNQYVNIGETGGLLAFIFFIALISRSFSRLGDARKLVDGDTNKEWLIWCLGSALFAHVVGFFGVNYFDQSRVGWFVLLAIISAITSPILRTQALPKDGPNKSAKDKRSVYGIPEPPRPRAKDLSAKPTGRLEPRFRNS